MVDHSSAGVFVEETPSQVQTVQAASTSNVGGVGYTPKGPTDVATLVTSFPQFVDKFGSFTKSGFLPLEMAAFFANGGKRAFVTRVMPSDAVAAEGYLQDQITDQQIETGDGATAAFTQAAPQAADLLVNGGDTPLVPGSFSVRWRGAGTAVVAENLRNRANSADIPLVNGTAKYEARVNPASIPTPDLELDAVVPGTGVLTWNPDGVGDRTLAINVTTSGVVTKTSVSGTSVTFDQRSGFISVKFAGTDIPVGGLVGNLRLAYTPASATFVAGDTAAAGVLADVTGRGLAFAFGTITTVVKGSLVDAETFVVSDGTLAVTFEFDDNGVTTPGNVPILLGPLTTANSVRDAIITAINNVPNFKVTASIGTGTGVVNVANKFPGTAGNVAITDTVAAVGFTHTGMSGGAVSTLVYDTGTYAITFSVAGVPHNHGRVLSSYKIDAWALVPISVGLWGNDLRVSVTGSSAYQDTVTGNFSRFNVTVAVRNPVKTTQFDVKESYEDLVFDDATHASFWADVINQLSDFVSVTEPGADENLRQLQTIAKTQIVAGGDESAGGKTVTASLGVGPVKKRTLKISFTGVNSGALVVTDDGAGNLVGAVDVTGNNLLTYGSASVAPTIDVKLSEAVAAGTLVTVTYNSGPAEATHSETLGDTAKKTFRGGVARAWKAGTEGTFTTGTYGRNQISSPTLSATSKGLFAFDKVEELMQVMVPDFVGDVTVTGDLLDYADGRELQPSGGDRFFILQTPKGQTSTEAVDWLKNSLNRTSKWAAVYWPHVKVADPLSPIGTPIVVPALGHIAGIYARTDAVRNVGKAPAGVIDGKLLFLTALETVPTLEDRNTVYKANINPLISSTATGMAVWGSRTIASPAEPEWRQINTRRTFMFVEKSVFNSTHWICFENNGQALWDKIKAQLDGFLGAQWDLGVFAGKTKAQGFQVVVDSSNNDANTTQVTTRVSLATNKPAEQAVFEFAQMTL